MLYIVIFTLAEARSTGPFAHPSAVNTKYTAFADGWILTKKKTLALRQKKRQNHQFNVILAATPAHQSIHTTYITSSTRPCSLTLWKEISMLWHGRFRQWRVRLHARVLSPFNLPFTLNQIPPGRNCTSGCKKKFDRLVVLLIAVSSRLRNEY